VSKQVARDYYKTTPWYAEFDKMKQEGVLKENWIAPEPLPPELKEIISNMYKSVCEAWIGEKFWNAPQLEEVMNSYKGFLEK